VFALELFKPAQGMGVTSTHVHRADGDGVDRCGVSHYEGAGQAGQATLPPRWRRFGAMGALTDMATVRCWGRNSGSSPGALGQGTTVNLWALTTDVDLGTGRTAAGVFGGVGSHCAVLDTGQVSWGPTGKATSAWEIPPPGVRPPATCLAPTPPSRCESRGTDIRARASPWFRGCLT
jgi:hypothetical protein